MVEGAVDTELSLSGMRMFLMGTIRSVTSRRMEREVPYWHG